MGEEGSGWLDVSQHVVVVPNNRGVYEMICNFLVTPFLCFFNLFLLQPDPTSDLFGCLVAFRVRQTSSQMILCSSLVTKNGDCGSPI